MEGKVTVIAYHRAKPGKERALREALLKVCAPTRAEKAASITICMSRPTTPACSYSTRTGHPKADLDAHLASPHIDAFRAVASDLLAEPPDITLWTEVGD